MKSLRFAFALVGAGALAACGTGEVGDTSLGKPGAPSPFQPLADKPADCIAPACEVFPLPVSPHLVRLTNAQWERTIQDLLRLPGAPGNSVFFPSDPIPKEFGFNAGDLLVTSNSWKAYRNAAEALAKLVTGDAASLDLILPAGAKAGAGDTTARVAAFVTSFLPRAYRRPVTATEIANVIAEGEKAVQSDATSDPFILRTTWILTAILQSPYFLYRTALGNDGPAVNGRARLGPYELAAKLSYAIWGTMPDDKLADYAKSGKLATTEGVAAVAKEMLADPRAATTLLDFHDQLFQGNHYEELTIKDDRSPDNFPTVYEKFFSDAREDVRQTVKELVVTNPGGFKELYTSSVAYVNPDLAQIYGIDLGSVQPTGFTRVQMNADRVGVLMHPGWLAYKGTPKDPSTILRGVYMVRHVLCLPIGAPPAAANGANPAKSTQPTNRERVIATTKGCGDGCHGGQAGVINPLGFGFEDFDSIGKHRTTETTQMGAPVPIDTSAVVPNVGTFPSAVPLLQGLAANPRAHACYTAHWSAYLNGTATLDVTPRYLSPALAVSLKGGSVRDIITELVQTDLFLTVSR